MLDSIVNFRDFGGLRSQFGGVVVRDRLFRSGAVATVDESDIARLQDLDFSLVVDLCYVGEREDEPSPWPGSVLGRVLSHDGDRTVEAQHFAAFRQGVMDESKSDEIYIEIYRDLPFDPYYRRLFARAMDRMRHVKGRILVHCSAGKDRTGMFVALIHHTLGVSREDITSDYMKSRDAPGLRAMAEPAARKMTERFGFPVTVDLMRHLLDVKPAYLDSFFDAIEQRCGAVDTYLDDLGIDEAAREMLRGRLLAV